MLKTYEELRKFLDDNYHRSYDNYPNYTIKFGEPDQNKATLHIMEGDELIGVVNCFTWKQTKTIRSAFAYGDNYRCKPLNWLHVTRALNDTMTDLQNLREEKLNV